MTILVTGGAGFIGSHFVVDWLSTSDEAVINLDALGYAGNLDNLAAVQDHPGHRFVHGDIRDRSLIDGLLQTFQPRAVIHLAAQTHVDRSIADPMDFVCVNVEGTATLLEAVRHYWLGLDAARRDGFRFLYVNTDEVYGSLAVGSAPFTEDQPWCPSNPYSASKAAAGHFVQAAHRTFGLPTLATYCTDNYGARHFPEKLIPFMVLRGLAGQSLPVYGDGSQLRDWLHVSDHCRALRMVLQKGVPGRGYNIGAGSERSNLEVVRAVCDLLDEIQPDAQGSRRRLIQFVADRPGHDRRYAVDTRRIEAELGWQPLRAFEPSLRETVHWYLAHPQWVQRVQSGAYRAWVERQYGTPAVDSP